MVSIMGKIPSNWLDDPEWEMLRRKAENRPVPKQLKQKVAAQRPQVRTRREEQRAQANIQDTEKEVVVNLKIAVPKIKPPDFRELYRVHRARIRIFIGTMGVAMLLVFGFSYFRGHKAQEVAGQPDSAEEQARAAFNPLVPLNNFPGASGDRQKPEFKFDQEKKVLGYMTKYNDTAMTISQQALPEQLKSDRSTLGSVAKSIGAAIRLETQKGVAYIATDQKTLTQTALFATDEVLVFIRTDKKLDNESWKFYINQLNPLD